MLEHKLGFNTHINCVYISVGWEFQRKMCKLSPQKLFNNIKDMRAKMFYKALANGKQKGTSFSWHVHHVSVQLLSKDRKEVHDNYFQIIRYPWKG